MSDRELLELAAKAAGIEGEVTEYGVCLKYGNIWRPHTDDGDALRLAVKLFDGHDMEVIWANARRLQAEFPELDEVAAYRYAITRAAAEIGRNMK